MKNSHESTLDRGVGNSVFLDPSLGGETMVATLIQARQCWLPSADAPIGATEIVRHDEMVLNFAPGDTVALDDTVSTIESQPRLAQTIGHSAALHCLKMFDIDQVAEQWVRVLESDRPGSMPRSRPPGTTA